MNRIVHIPSCSFPHQRRQLLQHPGQLPPQLFIVLFQPVNLFRVQPVGMGVDGYLVQIVGAPPLQGDQLPDGRKVHMEDIAVQGHLPHIGPGVGNAGLGHAPVYLGQLVRRHHHVQVPVPFPPCRQRSSRSRLRLGASGSFTFASSFSSGLRGSGEGGRLFSMPSSMFPFCSSVSSTVNKGLSLSFMVPPICPHGSCGVSAFPVPLISPAFPPFPLIAP